VAARPFHGQAFREDGMRVNGISGVPTCVHPFRIGAPPGAYASAGEPFPELVEPLMEQGVPQRRPISPLGHPLVVAQEVFIPGPEQLILPEDPQDLEAWMIAMLRTASGAAITSALEQAETIAAQRFSAEQIVAALRRVLGRELR
jgi:hypothetical protein